MKKKQAKEKDEECEENLANIPIDDKARMERLCKEGETGKTAKTTPKKFAETIKNPQKIDELSRLLCKTEYGKTSDSIDPAQIEKCQQTVSDLIKSTTSPVIKEIISRSQSGRPEVPENLQTLPQEILDNIFYTSDSNIDQVAMDTELELVKIEACTIDPNDIPDEKERKSWENKCKSIFKANWEQLINPKLDSLTCKVEVEDIIDEDTKMQLYQECNTEMDQKTQDPEWRIQTLLELKEIFQKKIIPMIKYSQIYIKDPIEREQKINAFLKKETESFHQRVSDEKFSSLNPAKMKTEKAKKREISLETRAKIINLINEPDSIKQMSLRKIAKVTRVGVSTVRRIALVELSREEFAIRFPEHKLSEEKRVRIVNLIKEPEFKKQKSQKKIAKVTGVHRTTVAKIASGILSLEELLTRFPGQKINKEKMAKIVKFIKEPEVKKQKSQREIGKETGVAQSTVAHIAKDILSPEEYPIRFPEEGISEEQRAKITYFVKNSDFNLTEIGSMVGVSGPVVANYAYKILENEYSKRFPPQPRTILGINIHKAFTEGFSSWGEKKGLKVLTEFEILKEIPRLKDIGSRPDNAIVIDDELRDLYNISADIEHIAIDYSIDTSQKRLYEKSLKGFQSKNTLFLYIPWALHGTRQPHIDYKISENVPYRENIRVLTPEQFFKFFRFTEQEKKIFKEKIEDFFRKSKGVKSLFETGIFEES